MLIKEARQGGSGAKMRETARPALRACAHHCKQCWTDTVDNRLPDLPAHASSLARCCDRPSWPCRRGRLRLRDMTENEMDLSASNAISETYGGGLS